LTEERCEMPTETIDIADQEKIQKETMHEPRGPHVKRDRAKKCGVCGMRTFQKEGICVLCKTGIRQAGETFFD